MIEIYSNSQEEILRVSSEGEFTWHPDADRLIENGNFNDYPSMKYILKALRKKPMMADDMMKLILDPERKSLVELIRSVEKHHGIGEEK